MSPQSLYRVHFTRVGSVEDEFNLVGLSPFLDNLRVMKDKIDKEELGWTWNAFFPLPQKFEERRTVDGSWSSHDFNYFSLHVDCSSDSNCIETEFVSNDLWSLVSSHSPNLHYSLL